MSERPRQQPPQQPPAVVKKKAPGLRPRCRVYFPSDDDWYEAIVLARDPNTGRSKLFYIYDEAVEWLDLAAEERRGHFKWVRPTDPAVPSAREAPAAKPPGGAATQDPAPAQPAASAPAPPPASDAGPPSGLAALGWKVEVFWEGDNVYFPGEIKDYNPDNGMHRILYDDLALEWMDLTAEQHLVRFTKPPSPRKSKPDPEGGDSPPEEEAQPPFKKPVGPVPEFVRVVCGDQTGTFNVARMCIVMSDGRDISPTEFERLAGKAASKKWKASIRVDKGNGKPGQTMGDWLVDKGLEQPRAPRAKVTSLDAVVRKQGAHIRSAAAAAAKPPTSGIVAAADGMGKLGHREGCMCVICKQARRTGKPWSGMQGGPGHNYWLPIEPPVRDKGAGPPPRWGKRAYVEACPQLVGGPLQTPLWRVPESRCIRGEADIAALLKSQYEEEDKEAAAAAAAGPGPPGGDQAGAPDTKPGSGGVGDNGGTNGALVVVNGNKKKAERKPTLKERLELCNATEAERLAFGKSGIHGWGLFAKVAMKQDSMVAEYRGTRVRPAVANLREKMYRKMGKDCYLFAVNDEIVIDATKAGTIARFTNHCCLPSMYTKVLEIDGEPRLVFFARTDIRPGQEMTYDYRFKEEEGENRLPCACGAPNCRGFLN